ncbi:cytokinin riboside 5'-monophosphate phosphoribohydrolase LOG-like [Elaeis guineensis]|uniref:cytokinin riboside 5'-monophosphate phosphoribohydrolase LOG-like n=1 Tax=Elaeis guineensis var. tenera TaxID=51953 RepID=UPI003C6D347D
MKGKTKNKKSTFGRICVYGASRMGYNANYQKAAMELGKELAARGINLVYGGGSNGLMGAIARIVHDKGCHVKGFIPKSLIPRELTDDSIGEIEVVTHMHERKHKMAQMADAFIALPGGYGTFEELLEVLTWAQLGIHKKPVGLLNVDGFYDSLLSLFDKATDQGFVTQAARNLIISAPSAKELVGKLETYVWNYESGFVWDVKDQTPRNE